MGKICSVFECLRVAHLPMELFCRPARMAFACIWILYFIYVSDIRSIPHKTESQLYTSKSLSWKILKNLVGRMPTLKFRFASTPPCCPPAFGRMANLDLPPDDSKSCFFLPLRNYHLLPAKKSCLRSINRFHWGHRPWQVYCPSSPPDATNQKEWSEAHRFEASFPITVFLVERTRRDLFWIHSWYIPRPCHNSLSQLPTFGHDLQEESNEKTSHHGVPGWCLSSCMDQHVI